MFNTISLATTRESLTDFQTWVCSGAMLF